MLSRRSNLGLGTFSLRVAYPARNTSVCCALSNGRPATRDAPCRDTVTVDTAAAIGTITVGNRSGSSMIAAACAFPIRMSSVTTFVRGTSTRGCIGVTNTIAIAFRGNSGLFIRSTSNSVRVCNSNLTRRGGNSMLAKIVNGCGLCGKGAPRIISPVLPATITNRPIAPAEALVNVVDGGVIGGCVVICGTAIKKASSVGFGGSTGGVSLVRGRRSRVITHDTCGGVGGGFTPNSVMGIANVIDVCGKGPRLGVVSVGRIPTAPRMSIPRNVCFGSFGITLSYGAPNTAVECRLGNCRCPSTASNVVCGRKSSVSLARRRCRRSKRLGVLTVTMLSNMRDSMLSIVCAVRAPIGYRAVGSTGPFVGRSRTSSVIRVAKAIAIANRCAIRRAPSCFSRNKVVGCLFIRSTATNVLVGNSGRACGINSRLAKVIIR